MTVVVTGAAGFIGRHLVNALEDRGQSVVAVDRRPFPTPAAGATVAVQGDLADIGDAAVEHALRSADVVFHLAGFPGVRERGPAADARRQRDNVDATARVVESVPLGVPLIVTSSSSVYGGTTGRPCAETDRLQPRGPYAASKVEVERACARRVSRGGLIAVARPFTVAGEGQRPDMAISRWIAQAVAGEPLLILGDPRRSRDITDVRDIVEGLLRMADRGVRATINLGTGRPQRLGDVVALVAAATGVELTTTVSPAGDDEPAATLADTARCEALLGFRPSTDIESLVARQVAAAVAALPAAP